MFEGLEVLSEKPSNASQSKSARLDAEERVGPGGVMLPGLGVLVAVRGKRKNSLAWFLAGGESEIDARKNPGRNPKSRTSQGRAGSRRVQEPKKRGGVGREVRDPCSRCSRLLLTV